MAASDVLKTSSDIWPGVAPSRCYALIDTGKQLFPHCPRTGRRAGSLSDDCWIAASSTLIFVFLSLSLLFSLSSLFCTHTTPPKFLKQVKPRPQQLARARQQVRRPLSV